MSLFEELNIEILHIKDRLDTDVDDLIQLSAMRERTRLFNKIRDMIQEKDTNNDQIAASVLAWAWEELSTYALDQDISKL